MRWASAAVPVALVLLMSVLLTACDTDVETPVAATTAALNVTPAVTIAPTIPTSTGPGNLASDIRVGLMGSFTGPGGSASLALKRGAQMAVDDLNKEGGVNGRKIALIERDDKGNPADGLTNVKDLIEKEKVVAVFGTASTPVGLAQAPVVQKSKVPWLIPLASGTEITHEPGSPSYIFRVAMIDSAQSKLMVDFATAHYKSIGLIYDDSAYGSLGRDDLEAQLKAANLTPVLVEPYKAASTPDDFKPLLAKLKEAAPDVVINWGMGTAAGNLKKAMKDAKEDLPMIGPWNLAQPEFHATANGLEAGTLVVDRFLYTAMRYPGNYGFIPHTLSSDGDPCDVLVANTRAIVPGAVIAIRPVGVLMMEDEAGGDEKIIAVPTSKLTQRYDKIRTYSDLPDITLQQIQHFFEHYKDLEPGKWVKVLRWGGAEDAQRLIVEGIERAKAKTKKA